MALLSEDEDPVAYERVLNKHKESLKTREVIRNFSERFQTEFDAISETQSMESMLKFLKNEM